MKAVERKNQGFSQSEIVSPGRFAGRFPELENVDEFWNKLYNVVGKVTDKDDGWTLDTKYLQKSETRETKGSEKKTVGVFATGLSYMSRPGSEPLRPLTMAHLLDEAAKKWGNSECFYDVPMNTRLTFRQLKDDVDLFASGLLKLGLNKGDRLGIWGPNSCRWIITFLAAAKIGLIIVPLNPGYEAPELLYALNHLSIKCLVLAEPVKTRDFYKILNEAIPDMKISKENDDSTSGLIESSLAPHLNTILYMGKERLDRTRLWADVQRMGNQKEEDLEKMRKMAHRVQTDDILYTPFTSGTTGRPKGVKISHFSQINGMFRVGKSWILSSLDRQCLTLPLFHQHGILVGLMAPLCFGCSVVIPSPTFSPSTAITIAAKEKCTWIHGTPTMHLDMINFPGFDLLDLSFIRGAVVGSASSSKTLLNEMKQKYRILTVTIGYGSTESNTMTLTHPHPQDTEHPEVALTSVGYPFENMEMKIIDARGSMVRVGETGEICCRSFSVMQGYWEEPEKTREVIDPAGWYHTGDAGYFLESGHLALVGRFKDMLIRGGENIYPKEIEDFLSNSSLEIEQVYVFGVSDERLGEVVAAWILPKPGVSMDTEHVKRVCEGKMRHSKIPVYIKFVQSKQDVPRTSIGKVQKTVMRQQYEKELGLSTETRVT